MKQQIFTVLQVCAILKLKKATVREKISNGQLKAFKFGRDWRILKDDLKAYLRASISDERALSFMESIIDNFDEDLPPATVTAPKINKRRNTIPAKNDRDATKSEKQKGKNSEVVVAGAPQSNAPQSNGASTLSVEFLQSYNKKVIYGVTEIENAIATNRLITSTVACEKLGCCRSQLERYETQLLHSFLYYLKQGDGKPKRYNLASEVEDLSKRPESDRRVSFDILPFRQLSDVQESIEKGDAIVIQDLPKHLNKGRGYCENLVLSKKMPAFRVKEKAGVKTYVLKTEIENFLNHE